MTSATPDIMLDIETISTQPQAVIVSVACVRFDAFADYQSQGQRLADFPSLHLLVDPSSQPQRHVSEDTLNWWSQQSPEVQESIFGTTQPRVSLDQALDQLHGFVWNQCRRLWCQGPNFDIGILENAYQERQKTPPWDYWRIRDARTIRDLVDMPRAIPTHDALRDCWDQILEVQRALRRLGCDNYWR